jgi:hypothetical protein
VSEYLVSLVIEQYGPIGVLAAVLWYRQTQMIRALVDLAEEHSSVDEDQVKSDLRLTGDD